MLGGVNAKVLPGLVTWRSGAGTDGGGAVMWKPSAGTGGGLGGAGTAALRGGAAAPASGGVNHAGVDSVVELSVTDVLGGDVRAGVWGAGPTVDYRAYAAKWRHSHRSGHCAGRVTRA